MGVKRAFSNSNLEKAKEDFKKMKVDMAPALVTKPYSSAGGLKKPFKPPTFLKTAKAVGGGEQRATATASAIPPPPLERRPSPLPPPLVREQSVSSRATISPSAKGPKKKKQSSSRSVPEEAPVEIVSDDDGGLVVDPAWPDQKDENENASGASMEVDHDAQEADQGDIEELSDVEGGVQLVHEYSTKVPVSLHSRLTFMTADYLLCAAQISNRRRGFDHIRAALYKVFFTNPNHQKLWNKIPKAPIVKKERYVSPSRLSDSSVLIEILFSIGNESYAQPLRCWRDPFCRTLAPRKGMGVLSLE
jgi:hypothetical protein